MNRIVPIIALLCGFVPPAMATQELPLTLQEAVSQALAKRTEMRMEKAQLDIAQSKIQQARSAFLPTLDLSSVTQRATLYDTFSGVAITGQIGGQDVALALTKTSPPYQVSNRLELGYTLYSGGRDTAYLAETLRSQDAARAQQKITERKVILQTAQAYWALRKAQVYTQSAARAEQFARVGDALAQTQLQAGRISALERQTAALKVLEKETAAIQAKNQLVEEVRKYRSALGFRGNETDDTDAIPPLTDEPEQTYDFIDSAADQPELLKTQAETQASQARIQAARAAYKPKVELYAQYGVIGRDGSDPVSVWSSQKSDYAAIGLRLNLNLFDGFKSAAGVQQARAEAELAQLRGDQMHVALTDATRDKVLRLETARSTLTLAQKQWELARMKENIAKTRWQSGQGPEFEYQQAQIESRDADDKVLLSRIDITLARLELMLVSTNYSRS